MLESCQPSDFVNFIAIIDKEYSLLAKYSLWCVFVNFLASFMMSWLWFRFNILELDTTQKSRNELFKELKLMNDSYRNHKYIYEIFVLKHSIITGILASTIIWLQFPENTNVSTAIIYGIAGPYILVKKLRSEIASETKESISNEKLDLEKIINIENADYLSELEEIENKLKEL